MPKLGLRVYASFVISDPKVFVWAKRIVYILLAPELESRVCTDGCLIVHCRRIKGIYGDTP